MAERFDTVTGSVVPLGRDNVDTDQILPARFLKLSRGDGLERALFHEHRFDEAGAPRGDFPLDDPAYAGSPILLAGRNFGTGSSREAAVYALYDFGIRCVIAPSFAGIFFGNALRNGLLPVRLEAAAVARLLDLARAPGGLSLTVDLRAGEVALPDGEALPFEVPGLQRICLLSGKDELEVTIEHEAEVEAFVAAYEAAHPWTRGRAA